MTKFPKYLTSHPAVKFIDSGDNQGSDYRWYIELKDGWCLSRGRNEGGGSIFIHSRDDLERHGIVTVEEYRAMCLKEGRHPHQLDETT